MGFSELFQSFTACCDQIRLGLSSCTCTSSPALRTDVAITSQIHQEFHHCVICCVAVVTSPQREGRTNEVPGFPWKVLGPLPPEIQAFQWAAARRLPIFSRIMATFPTPQSSNLSYRCTWCSTDGSAHLSLTSGWLCCTQMDTSVSTLCNGFVIGPTAGNV